MIGAVACFGIMLLLNPIAAVAATLVIIGTYIILARRVYRTAWGDMRSGFWFSMARMSLLKFAKSRQHRRNWRPALLVLYRNLKGSEDLLRFSRYLEANRGILFLSHVLLGDWRSLVDLEVVVSEEPPLDVISTESEHSAVTFVGVSIRTLEEEAGPLSSYTPLVDHVKGNLFLTKNWHDLEL